MQARRWWLGWVLCALVCAQALGFMHRVVHMPPAGPAAAHATAGEAGAPTAWIGALFAAHDDASGCRLFDAIGHDGLPLPVLFATLAIPAADAALPCTPRAPPHRWVALFQARGPPLSR